MVNLVLISSEEMNKSKYLQHHGVKGQRRGIRRWQNEDGSYTSEGYEHYAEMYGWGKGDKKGPGRYESSKGNSKGSDIEEGALGRGPEHNLGNDPDLQEQAVEEAGNLVLKVDKYQNMSPERKRKFGDQLLSYVKEANEACQSAVRNGDHVPDYVQKAIINTQQKLIDLIYDHVGSINAADYNSDTKAYKAEEKCSKIFDELYDLEKSIKATNGFKQNANEYNNIRLKTLLEKNSTWKNLNIQYNKAQDDVMGAILQDLGFADTPANRSIIYGYGWWD